MYCLLLAARRSAIAESERHAYVSESDATSNPSSDPECPCTYHGQWKRRITQFFNQCHKLALSVCLTIYDYCNIIEVGLSVYSAGNPNNPWSQS